MKIKLLVSTFFLALTFISFAQNVSYFKPWKSKEKFKNCQIIFQIDTTCSVNDVMFLLHIVKKIDDNLKNKDIKIVLMLLPNDTVPIKNVLCLKLEKLNFAYVKLNTYDDEIPLCFRARLTQTQPITKKLIKTELSVSLAERELGINELGIQMANELLKHFELDK